MVMPKNILNAQEENTYAMASTARCSMTAKDSTGLRNIKMCSRHVLSSDRTTKALLLASHYKPQPPLMTNPDHLQTLASCTKKRILNME